MATLRDAALRALGPTNLRLLALLAALVLVFGLSVGDRLFASLGLRSMASQLPELGLLSLAMMVALLSGGLDLSIIATANLSALAVAAVLKGAPGEAAGLTLAAIEIGAVLAGVGVAAVVGTVNGILVGYLRVSPILATLGTMTLVKGLAVGLTHGSVVSGFPAGIVFLGNGSVLGVPMPLILFAAVAVPLGALLTRTPFGVVTALMGSNQQAVRFSGVDTRAALLRVYLLSAVVASSAGLVMMARFDSANAAYGESYLLVTILACVLGGVSPTGGFGRVGGLVIALVILQLISTACVLLDLSQFLTLALWGGILLAVGLTGVLRHQLSGLLAALRAPAIRPAPPGLR
jgi:simple sugar transport system permease protein/ribose transport system permease protein